MATVTSDIIDGNKLANEAEGYTFTRMMQVEGVSTASTGLGGAVSVVATTSPETRGLIAVQSTGVAIGDSLGSGAILSEAYCVTRNATMLSADVARVDLTYRRFDPTPKYNGETSTIEMQSEVDKTGTQVKLQYDGVDHGVSFPVRIPETRLVVTRYEQGIAPGAVSQTLVGKLNASTWQGGSPGTWMCTGVTFSPAHPALVNVWSMRYEFAYLDSPHTPEGHQPRVAYVDPTTGKPPDDLVDGQSIKTIDFYDTFNFASLGI